MWEGKRKEGGDRWEGGQGKWRERDGGKRCAHPLVPFSNSWDHPWVKILLRFTDDSAA